MSPSLRVLTAFLASYAAGLVGFLFVGSQLSSWYEALSKPPLTPSASVFVIVWILLYALMALALSIVWTKNPQDALCAGWARFFFVQLLFNAAWTIFFFGFHATLIAFFDILFLIFIIAALMASAYEIDSRVNWLLLPYLIWVLFAGYLNLGVWFLN
jgi:benzodiazapine receptor